MTANRKRTVVLVAVVASAILAFVCVAGYLAIREPAAPASLPGLGADPLPADRAVRAGIDVGSGHTRVDLSAVGAAWYMNWTYKPDPALSGEFVPLVCGYPGRHPVTAKVMAEARTFILAHRDRYPDGTLWLVGNEIGNRAQNDHRSPAVYAVDFQRCFTMLKSINPTFKVSVGPAVLSTNSAVTKDQVAGSGLNYLREVIHSYRSKFGAPIPAEYFAATAYVVPDGGFGQLSFYRHAHHRLDAAVFTEQIRNLRRLLAEEGLRDRSVILTEIGDPFAGGQPATIARFMTAAATYAATATDDDSGCPSDTNHLIQRWAWFLAQPLSTPTKLRRLQGAALIFDLAQTSLFDREGHPTYLAHIYAQLTGREPRPISAPATDHQP